MFGVDFFGSYLNFASFNGANIPSSVFDEAECEDCDFTSSICTGCSFIDCEFPDCFWDGATHDGSDYTDADTSNASVGGFSCVGCAGSFPT